jgi:hypothetical protein
MSDINPYIDLDGYLFSNCMTLADYFISVTPFSETVCYRNRKGQEFYLSIRDDALEEKIRLRLIELGVEIVSANRG